MDETDPNNVKEEPVNTSPIDPIVTVENIVKNNGKKITKSVIDPGDALNGLGFMFSFVPFLGYPAFIVSSIGVKRSRKAGHKGYLGIFGMLISSIWVFILPLYIIFTISTTPIEKIVPAPVIQGIAGIANSNPVVSGIFQGLAGNPTDSSQTSATSKDADCQKIVDTMQNVASTGDVASLVPSLQTIATESTDPEITAKLNTVIETFNTGQDTSAALTDVVTYCSTSVISLQ